MERSKTYANLDLLSAVARSPPKLGKAIIKNAEDTLIDAISECALQIVEGTVPVTETSKAARVKKVLPFLKLLSKRKLSRRKKRNFLLQKGFGLLALIIPPVLSYILGKT